MGELFSLYFIFIILDLCQLPRLTFRGNEMKPPHTSPGIMEINFKRPPCLIWISPNKYLPYIMVKFKIKCLPVSWLSIAFSDTDLMFKFCIPRLIFMMMDYEH